MMNWDIIIAVLSSSGLTTLFSWLFNRKKMVARTRLDRDDIAREMREKDGETIQQLFDENKEMFKEVLAIKRLILKMVACKYYTQCPARYELQDYKQKYFNTQSGQSHMEQKGFRYPRDNPTKPGGTDDSGGQPP